MLVCPFCRYRIKCASCNDYVCESCGGDLLSVVKDSPVSCEPKPLPETGPTEDDAGHC